MAKRGTPKRSKTDKPAGKPAGSGQASDQVFPMREHIGRKLKAMFDEVVDQPLPDRLRKLLGDLDRQ
jgi:Anti-sigma factor NepR